MSKRRTSNAIYSGRVDRRGGGLRIGNTTIGLHCEACGKNMDHIAYKSLQKKVMRKKKGIPLTCSKICKANIEAKLKEKQNENKN